MSRLRPLFASTLLTIAVLGTVVAPAAHWAGHGSDGHLTHVEVVDGATYADEPSDSAHDGECPDCAHLQKVLSSDPSVVPSYAGIAGLERSPLAPETPAIQTDVATPEGRGPPAAV